jgi:hypothetical protein
VLLGKNVRNEFCNKGDYYEQEEKLDTVFEILISVFSVNILEPFFPI